MKQYKIYALPDIFDHKNIIYELIIMLNSVVCL